MAKDKQKGETNVKSDLQSNLTEESNEDVQRTLSDGDKQADDSR